MATKSSKNKAASVLLFLKENTESIKYVKAEKRLSGLSKKKFSKK